MYYIPQPISLLNTIPLFQSKRTAVCSQAQPVSQPPQTHNSQQESDHRCPPQTVCCAHRAILQHSSQYRASSQSKDITQFHERPQQTEVQRGSEKGNRNLRAVGNSWIKERRSSRGSAQDLGFSLRD
ncbi:hypothetical protein Ddc_11015 [Ditylenchus destructor]|nr:hypothetical protein Ddc_11015 [Ditylenchus destructor]